MRKTIEKTLIKLQQTENFGADKNEIFCFGKWRETCLLEGNLRRFVYVLPIVHLTPRFLMVILSFHCS